MHDPLLARFHTVDPLFADYPGQSPWSHCAANPLNFIDPTGKWSVQVHASPDRGSNPYAVLSVFSNDDVMVLRTIVKVIDKLTKEDPSDVPNVVFETDDIMFPVKLNNREDILLICKYILEELIVNEKKESNN